MKPFITENSLAINILQFLTVSEFDALAIALQENSKDSAILSDYAHTFDIYSKQLFATYLSDLLLYS